MLAQLLIPSITAEAPLPQMQNSAEAVLARQVHTPVQLWRSALLHGGRAAIDAVGCGCQLAGQVPRAQRLFQPRHLLQRRRVRDRGLRV